MRCVLIDPYATRNADRLSRALKTSWEIRNAALRDSEEALSAELSAADVAIAQGWSRRLGRRAPKLRLLQLPQAGTDAVDWSALADGCMVCNVFEHETPVAEFVLLAMLESRVDLRGLDRSFRDGDWSRSHRFFGPRHGELAGATVGLIGYGRIGAAVARRASALDMTVVAVSRRTPNDPLLAWSGDMSDLDTMLPRCDFLVIACPLAADTVGLINQDRLALMRSAAFLINVARGEIVDEAALFTALSDGRIAGAALDVWWLYPEDEQSPPNPSRFPFEALPNVLMTPHVAAWTDAMLDRRWKRIADNLDRLALGEPLGNMVARPEKEIARSGESHRAGARENQL